MKSFMQKTVYPLMAVMVVIATAATLFLAGVAQAAESDEELAKKTQNPVASLISVPLQSNWDFNTRPQ